MHIYLHTNTHAFTFKLKIYYTSAKYPLSPTQGSTGALEEITGIFCQTVILQTGFSWNSPISAETVCSTLQSSQIRRLGIVSLDVANVNHTWPIWLPLMLKSKDLWTSQGRAVACHWCSFSKRSGTGSHTILVCKLGYYSLENQMNKNQFHW